MTAGLATAQSGPELIPGEPQEVEALAARLAALGDGLSEAAARPVDLGDGDWRGRERAWSSHDAEVAQRRSSHAVTMRRGWVASGEQQLRVR